MSIKISASTNPPPIEKLGDYIKELNGLDIDYIHCDIFDGHFVPTFTFSFDKVAEIKKTAKLPLDVHLMVVKPQKVVKKFIKAGADILTVHYEAFGELRDDNTLQIQSKQQVAGRIAKNKKRLIKTLLKIAKLGALPGLAVKPETPIKDILDIVPYCGLILIMSVEGGYSGQEFIEGTYKKIKELKTFLKKAGYNDILIEVDGGVNTKNVKKAAGCGVDMVVVGHTLYASQNRAETVKELKSN